MKQLSRNATRRNTRRNPDPATRQCREVSLAASRSISSRSRVAVPVDFDPEEHPILATHYFGLNPNWRSLGEIIDDAQTDSNWTGRSWDDRAQIRIGPLVEHLYSLGPRPLFEFFSEFVACDTVLAVDIEEQLRHYARINSEMVDALDGREIRLPIIVIEGGRR